VSQDQQEHRRERKRGPYRWGISCQGGRGEREEEEEEEEGKRDKGKATGEGHGTYVGKKKKKRKRKENTQKGRKQVINERARHQGSKGKLQKKGRVERERESGLSLSDIHIKKRARQGVRWWGKKKRRLLAICGRPEGVKQVL